MGSEKLKQLHPFIWVVILVATLVQTLYLLESRDDPTFDIPIIDASVYHQAAIRVANGKPIFDDAFWQPPLFPYLLGWVYHLFGVNIWVAKVILAILAVADCALIQRITEKLFSKPLGLVAGIGCAIYGPLLFFSTRLLPVGLATFLILLAILLGLESLRTSNRYSWLAFGFVAGLATITVPNAGILLIMGVVYWLIKSVRHRPVRPSLRPMGLIMLGGILPLGTVTVRNVVVSGQWVLISTNGGINFYVGNNAHTEETLTIRPGDEWRRFTRSGEAVDMTSRAERSRYFFRQSMAWIRGNPMAFLKGVGLKSWQLIHGQELPRNMDPYAHREFSGLLSALLWRSDSMAFPFGLLAPFVAVGMLVSWLGADDSRQQRTGRWALMLFILLYGLSITAFFVTARYRLPLALVTIPLAVVGFQCFGQLLIQTTREAAEKLSQQIVRWRLSEAGPVVDRSESPENPSTIGSSGFEMASKPSRWIIVFVFLGVSYLSNRPLASPTDRINFRAEMDMCVGDAYIRRGQLETADAYLSSALARDEHYVTAACKLAYVKNQQGDVAGAEQLLQQATLWNEQAVEPLYLLGEFYGQQQRLEESREAFDKALALDPASPEAHSGLAEWLVNDGQLEEAINHYRLALRVTLRPGPLLIRLGELLARQEHYEEAIECYRKALWRFDPQPEALNRIAWLLATCPEHRLRDCQRAIEIAEHLCEVTDYEHSIAMDTLAAAYAECTRWTDAVFWAKRAYTLARFQGDQEAAQSIHARLVEYEQRLQPQ